MFCIIGAEIVFHLLHPRGRVTLHVRLVRGRADSGREGAAPGAPGGRARCGRGATLRHSCAPLKMDLLFWARCRA